jgi:ligand-binding SRPBCC domain-containing protein
MLELIKSVRADEKMFPFYAHADINLLGQEEELFKVKLMKLANGLLRVTSDTPTKVVVKSQAVKSGARFQDEQAYFPLRDNWQECYVFVEDKEQGVKMKQEKVKSTFRVEMNESEKTARDS